MKKIIIGALAVLFLSFGCSKADSEVIERLDNLENRVTDLELLCQTINSNISSLQALISAVEKGDYITDVQPILENDIEIGYKITFNKKGTITIYHGSDGEDGSDGQDGKDGKDGQDGIDGKDGVDVGETPDLGIRKDEDGAWYWTLNDSWLLDEDGNKIKAVATDGTDGFDGTDGVTPKLKIENEYWYVSYDNGQTWEDLGCKASGEDGMDGGDSIFKRVYKENGYVCFELKNGDLYKLPESSSGLSISFSVEQGAAIAPESTLKVGYAVSGGEGEILVRAVYSDLLEVAVKPVDNTSGYIYIYAGYIDSEDRNEIYDEEYFGDATEGNYYDTSLALVISVSDSKGNHVTKSLNLTEGIIDSITDAYLADATECSVQASVKTNVSYAVSIPTHAASWISYAPTKAAIRTDLLDFSVKENTGNKFRSARISLRNDMSQEIESFVIVQRSSIADQPITFADAKVKKVVTDRYDTNGDGELSYEEAAMVTDIKDLFRLEKQIVSFDEFEFFTSVTEIPSSMFSGCKKLTSVKLPSACTVLGDDIFNGCISLTSITMPEDINMEDSGSYWFRGCTSLEEITLPENMTELPYGCFYNCTSLKSINIPVGATEIPSACFYGCESLSSVKTTKPIERIGDNAFYGCLSLTVFDLSGLKNIQDEYGYDSSNPLGSGAFAYSGLTSVTIPVAVTELSSSCFEGCEALASVTLHNGIKSIGSSCFAGTTSLLSITMPSDLTTIHYYAFQNSAIEAPLIEGTKIRVLDIPGKVTEIGHGAFNGCKNLSAVKMNSEYPPVGEGYMFDSRTIIYVQEELLEAYKDAYAWADMTILPYEMMTLSVTFEQENGKLAYSNYSFVYTFDVTVSSEAVLDGDDFSEYGYYVIQEPDQEHYEIEYYPLYSYNVSTESSFMIDYLSEYDNLEKTIAIGAYLRLSDGTIMTFDQEEVNISYDNTASFRFVEATVDGNRITLTYNVSGAYWLSTDLEKHSSGDGYEDLYIYGEYIKDGINNIEFSWQYVPDGSQEEYSRSIYYTYIYDDQEVWTNALLLKGDNENNITVEIVE